MNTTIKKYEGQNYSFERALYGIDNAKISFCNFQGEEDGESALKETADLEITNCNFHLRYPLWHTKNTTVKNSYMSETCRAALWYDENVSLTDCKLYGIKALRECDKVTLNGVDATSPEILWYCKNVEIKNSKIEGEYPFLESKNVEIDNLTMNGKYSFQYVDNVVIRNSYLDTKDAFWNSKNVTVYDSVIKAEYLGWYSENLKLVRCKIIGTQPLCYAKKLVLEDCEMENCDLAFEKSEVKASVKGEITSVKNPFKGRISADSIGEIILTDKDAKCKIVQRA